MVNTFGALIVSQACLDLLIQSRGRIINIASESSPFRPPFQIYQSSKMALECISDVMRRELMLFDVHVAIIRPGATDTNLIEDTKVVPIDVEGSRFEPFFPRLRKLITNNVPKKLSRPSEVAAVVFRAAVDPRKKVLYRINNDPKQRLVSWLPSKLVDRVLLKQIRGTPASGESFGACGRALWRRRFVQFGSRCRQPRADGDRGARSRKCFDSGSHPGPEFRRRESGAATGVALA